MADIQTADMLNLPVPKATFHTEVIKPSEFQQEMVLGLADRAEIIRDRGVSPHEDNMLKVTNDGRKLALDQRLMNELLPDEPEGKVSVCARNVYRIWEETKEKSLTQLVFCDLSTPKNDGTFNVYDDLRTKLIEKGIPKDEIAFIHDANSEVQKKEMFAKVRSGSIRVLLGSTAKMGSGTNVQKKLIAIHDLDCPWRPSDLEQRLGRLVRQGNSNKEVEVYRYVTEGTFDAYLYQLIENKQRFIAQIMTSKTPVRSAEDVDEAALSYAEIKALATGNPRIIEKCQLEMEVNRLKILQASFLDQRYSLEEKVHRQYPQSIQVYEQQIKDFQVDIKTVENHPTSSENFSGMKVKGVVYSEKADAGNAIIQMCKEQNLTSGALSIGEYRGFQMILTFDSFSKNFILTLSGEASHQVQLSSDIHGNITRLDNELARIPKKLETAKVKYEEAIQHLANAKEELEKPFAQAEEFNEKSQRLNELNIELNLDDKDIVIIDEDPEQGSNEPEHGDNEHKKKSEDRER